MPTQTRKTILLATDQGNSIFIAQDENEAQSSAYTPYGHQPLASNRLSLLGFNGELLDPRTQQYPLGKGYRSYNPVLMRFMSPDSLSPYGAGGRNAYAYCEVDPVNQIDSTGHFGFFKALGKVLGFRSNTAHKKAEIINTSVKNDVGNYPIKKSSFFRPEHDRHGGFGKANLTGVHAT
ncbi:MAG TPA: RHS repeat-associated core domain-containing protein, partial [Pseudomonas sp.]|nr:RHS repeat-associated core domain-containing protein [Pseudomonas sp.]